VKINKAIQYVMEASLTKEEKLRYEKNWDRISSEKTLLTTAKDEGLEEGVAIGVEKGRVEGKAEGIEEGKKHEKIEIAKKLKELGMSAFDF